jgi:hypothetical protein
MLPPDLGEYLRLLVALEKSDMNPRFASPSHSAGSQRIDFQQFLTNAVRTHGRKERVVAVEAAVAERALLGDRMETDF